MQLRVGEYQLVYDPSVGEAESWYINDHTVVRSVEDGSWHMIGITHAEPADPLHEVDLAHAVAPSLHGPWAKQPFALSVDSDYGETHLWAHSYDRDNRTVERLARTLHLAACAGDGDVVTGPAVEL